MFSLKAIPLSWTGMKPFAWTASRSSRVLEHDADGVVRLHRHRLHVHELQLEDLRHPRLRAAHHPGAAVERPLAEALLEVDRPHLREVLGLMGLAVPIDEFLDAGRADGPGHRRLRRPRPAGGDR